MDWIFPLCFRYFRMLLLLLVFEWFVKDKRSRIEEK